MWEDAAQQWVAAPQGPPPPPPPGGGHFSYPSATRASGSVLPAEEEKRRAEWVASLRARPSILIGGLLVFAVLAVAVFAGSLLASSPENEPPAPAAKPASAPDDETPTALSPKAFTKKIDRRCARTAEQAKALAPPATPEAVVSYLKRVRKLGRGFVTYAEGLGAPPKHAAKWQRYLDLNRRVLKKLDAIVADLSMGGAAADIYLNEIGALGERANRLEKTLGMKRCARYSS